LEVHISLDIYYHYEYQRLIINAYDAFALKRKPIFFRQFQGDCLMPSNHPIYPPFHCSNRRWMKETNNFFTCMLLYHVNYALFF
jgi:hypothetical protein